jgi:hypothetical protein
MPPSYVGAGNRVFSVIGAYVAIDIQEPHQLSALSHAYTGELGAERLSAMLGGQARELASQRLDLRCPVEPEEPAEADSALVRLVPNQVPNAGTRGDPGVLTF